MNRARAQAGLVAGGLLIGLAALLHPPGFDPDRSGPAFAAAGREPLLWIADHATLALGLALWSAGLASVLAGLRARRRPSPYAALAGGLLAAAAGPWLVALTVEVTVFPRLPAAPPLWAELVWPPVLALGYLGGALQWLALTALALELRARRGAAGLGRWGLLALPPGLAGFVLAWALPGLARPLLALTVAPGAVWSLVLPRALRDEASR